MNPSAPTQAPPPNNATGSAQTTAPTTGGASFPRQGGPTTAINGGNPPTGSASTSSPSPTASTAAGVGVGLGSPPGSSPAAQRPMNAAGRGGTGAYSLAQMQPLLSGSSAASSSGHALGQGSLSLNLSSASNATPSATSAPANPVSLPTASASALQGFPTGARASSVTIPQPRPGGSGTVGVNAFATQPGQVSNPSPTVLNRPVPSLVQSQSPLQTQASGNPLQSAARMQATGPSPKPLPMPMQMSGAMHPSVSQSGAGSVLGVNLAAARVDEAKAQGGGSSAFGLPGVSLAPNSSASLTLANTEALQVSNHGRPRCLVIVMDTSYQMSSMMKIWDQIFNSMIEWTFNIESKTSTRPSEAHFIRVKAPFMGDYNVAKAISANSAPLAVQRFLGNLKYSGSGRGGILLADALGEAFEIFSNIEKDQYECLCVPIFCSPVGNYPCSDGEMEGKVVRDIVNELTGRQVRTLVVSSKKFVDISGIHDVKELNVLSETLFVTHNHQGAYERISMAIMSQTQQQQASQPPSNNPAVVHNPAATRPIHHMPTAQNPLRMASLPQTSIGINGPPASTDNQSQPSAQAPAPSSGSLPMQPSTQPPASMTVQSSLPNSRQTQPQPRQGMSAARVEKDVTVVFPLAQPKRIRFKFLNWIATIPCLNILELTTTGLNNPFEPKAQISASMIDQGEAASLIDGLRQQHIQELRHFLAQSFWLRFIFDGSKYMFQIGVVQPSMPNRAPAPPTATRLPPNQGQQGQPTPTGQGPRAGGGLAISLGTIQQNPSNPLNQIQGSISSLSQANFQPNLVDSEMPIRNRAEVIDQYSTKRAKIAPAEVELSA